ncbi:MAG: 2-C-methyl-D-erythritol 2,4-cyclodiphosphate synthase [Cyclobacteriaceae bacterium]
MKKPLIRIGYGYDVHQLAEGHDLWLGGIKIEHHKGSVGHSDADVIIHVICDALLGAANMRDIGYHFSDTDPKYKGIDSKKLLAEVMTKLRTNHYEVGNIDVTLEAQEPKIKHHIPKMVEVLADVMEVDPGDISVKATTTERLGFVGREEGVAAHAVALIFRADKPSVFNV